MNTPFGDILLFPVVVIVITVAIILLKRAATEHTHLLSAKKIDRIRCEQFYSTA